jgi:peptide methionine sulfoxide reductase MsrB
MQAVMVIKCRQCEKFLGRVFVDTANMPEDLQRSVNQVILAHRENCKYYKDQGLPGLMA